jgi:hypothetical protein
MGYFIPLFVPHPLFRFLDQSKTKLDLDILKGYFESDDPANAIRLLEEYDVKWQSYFEELLNVRRTKLFGSKREIPDEKIKIDELSNAGNKLAVQMKKIFEVQKNIPRKWPVPEIEKERQKYKEWREKPKMRDEALDYFLFEALKEVIFPHFFFEQEIFKLEEAYKDFKYGFIDFLGSEALFMSFLIYKREGNERVFDNMRDFIVNRYFPKQIFGVDAISLIGFFIETGNDANNCNRFFTRRMKDNIYRESMDHTYLTNNMTSPDFEYAFKTMFYADSDSLCNLKNPFKDANNMPGLIEQAVFNHLIGNYAAATNLLFPLIEGIIWDISVSEHLRNQNIYTKDSDLTTRDVRNRTLLREDGSPVPKPHRYPTLQELLESTRMRDIINADFLKMLIQEMYPSERNPILHGVKLDYNDPWQSSRMLLMLEYLHHLIKKQKYVYPEQLDEVGYWTPEKSKEPSSNVFFA